MTDVSFDRSADEFASLLDGLDEEPVVARLEATLDVDIEPLAAYTALSGESDYGFLLESAEKTPSSDPDGAFDPDGAGDRHARYSFVGYDPDAVVSVWPQETEVEDLGGAAAAYVTPNGGDTLDSLRAALPDLPRVGFPPRERQQLDGGLVGFLAYDAVYDLWLEEVGIERPDPIVPDAQFVLTTRTLVFDHAADTVSLVFTPVVRAADGEAVYDDLVAEAASVAETLATHEADEPGGFVPRSERAGQREAYEDAVRRAKEHVLDGDIYQGVISRKRELRGEVDARGFYRALREVNPSPYMYLLRHDDRSIVGASPETLVSVQGSHVVSNPIAGTCPRGSSPVEDRRLAGEMLADAKERAEHTMLVDLARNDVRRVAEPGSVRVEEFMSVLKYSHVQHIESTVTGTLAGENDAFDATRATFPAGTLTGAPKVRAMEIIDDLEREPRGVYGGGVGYYSWAGDADFAIVIRTATIEHGVPIEGDEHGATEDVVTVQAGAGIVADSVPESEYEETEQKMGGVLAALEAIETDGEGGADATEGEPVAGQEASR
ncbi:anthranilate synthase component I [Salinigranum halophilum]|uniref:anthranilate synthase component I n=1 Tax=Salinigranum halophilum TaxID=2565931 RepID=UPI0010A7660F|nr:anthranilate synthase component I [Salinigranum halophilum]